MSKLTREVKYLQESDRPKKVEPMEFSDWMLDKHSENTFNVNSNSHLNKRVSEYATYLQEFSADDVPVEFTHHVWDYMQINQSKGKPTDWETVTHLGKINSHDAFLCNNSTGGTNIFFGKLNSGKF